MSREIRSVNEACRGLRVRRSTAEAWLRRHGLVHPVEVGGETREWVIWADVLDCIRRDGAPAPAPKPTPKRRRRPVDLSALLAPKKAS